MAMIAAVPLLGFVVLSLFGDAIRDHGEGLFKRSRYAPLVIVARFATS